MYAKFYLAILFQVVAQDVHNMVSLLFWVFQLYAPSRANSLTKGNFPETASRYFQYWFKCVASWFC